MQTVEFFVKLARDRCAVTVMEWPLEIFELVRLQFHMICVQAYQI